MRALALQLANGGIECAARVLAGRIVDFIALKLKGGIGELSGEISGWHRKYGGVLTVMTLRRANSDSVAVYGSEVPVCWGKEENRKIGKCVW